LPDVLAASQATGIARAPVTNSPSPHYGKGHASGERRRQHTAYADQVQADERRYWIANNAARAAGEKIGKAAIAAEGTAT